jgi:hypothetical protein
MPYTVSCVTCEFSMKSILLSMAKSYVMILNLLSTIYAVRQKNIIQDSVYETDPVTNISKLWDGTTKKTILSKMAGIKTSNPNIVSIIVTACQLQLSTSIYFLNQPRPIHSISCGTSMSSFFLMHLLLRFCTSFNECAIDKHMNCHSLLKN